MVVSKFACPQCGVKFEIRILQTMPAGFRPEKWQDFGYVAGPGQAPPLAAGMSYVKKESARAPVKEDVYVPVAWSAITGVAIAGVAMACTIGFDWPWYWPPVACFAGAGVTWVLLLVDWRAMLWRVETITGMDVDKDGSKGKPEKPSTHMIDYTDHTKKRKSWIEMPVDEAMMARIAKAYESGRFEFSRRDMMAATSISDGSFEKLQKLFLERGWAVYRKEGSPNVGVELTVVGKHVLKSYLPTPE